MSMTLVTLNRTLICQETNGRIHKVSAFTGKFAGRHMLKGDLDYRIVKIHEPASVDLSTDSVYLTFRETAVAATQEVK